MTLNVVLVEPEIPQNTGNIARTCACTGAHLHLVAPLGFQVTSRNMKRAGCDYWDQVNVTHWSCLRAFLDEHGNDELRLFTGQSEVGYADVTYSQDTYLLFGRESAGLPQDFIDAYKASCVRIPMRDGLRSLNLSNAVAIGVYEALRQHEFAGLV